MWKLIWKELFIYTLTFLSISLLYRYGLNAEQQRTMEQLIKWCREQSTGLPLTFLLGFYVSLVVRRWWEQYCKLPWPDDIALSLRGVVTGEDNQKARIVRRTVIRYCLVSYVLCLRRVSTRLRKRFPTVQTIVASGLIDQYEGSLVGEERSGDILGSNWWLPLKWSTEVLVRAEEEGLVSSGPAFSALLSRLTEFRSGLVAVATYGQIRVPLVYTQVVTLAVYIYFAVSLIGEQSIKEEKMDIYYPIFMTVKFLFYFGWLRVAETLYNPLGEDDEDFELNDILNRHIKVSFTIVDQTDKLPPLKKDVFWDKIEPELLDQEDRRVMEQNSLL